MIQYVKNAFAELEHVVWPTKRETRSYFKIVVSFIIVATLILFILGYIFGEIIFGAKTVISGDTGTNVELQDIPTNIQIIEEDPATDTAPDDTNDIQGDVQIDVGENGVETDISSDI